MIRDTFGGPSACHITHQSVGFGYLGPDTWTVAECAAWLIRLFLQIADQWLWVGRWIFPFPFSTLLFRFPLLVSVTEAWCMWRFHEVHRMTDTSRRGGRLTGWLGDRHPHGALTWTIRAHLFPHHRTPLVHFCCTHWSYWTLWRVLLWASMASETPRTALISPGESQLFHPFIHYWHMLVPEWPPWKNQMHKALLQKWLTTEWFTFKVMVKIFSSYYGPIPQFLSWESINVGQEYSSLSTSLIPPNCMSKYPWVRYWTLNQPNASIRVWMLG